MTHHLRILRPEDLNVILDFEKYKLGSSASSWENESHAQLDRPLNFLMKEMESWVAPWRPESLSYYLQTGWCFGAYTQAQTSQDVDLLLGYVLAQPLLFFQGQTQTLWVEYLTYTQSEVGEQLLEALYRWSRDKHLQRVLISQVTTHQEIATWARKLGGQILKNNVIEIATTKK